MQLCYIDESGTPAIPGTTSHYILAGLSIPIYHWRTCEDQINRIKINYGLADCEIHTGWILRQYSEESTIIGFASMPQSQRRAEVDKLRRAELLRLQQSSSTKNLLQQTKKNHRHTNSYIHLTYAERQSFIFEIAKAIGSWGFARLFAECVDKVHFDPRLASSPIDEQAFEQLVSRFATYLAIQSTGSQTPIYGILIHDNNETVAKRHTELMKHFHKKGTLWTNVSNIIETPLFVDSSLTSMIQMADVCAYALRRYFEKAETNLLNEIYKRADRKGTVVVGIRHFSASICSCLICQSHKPTIFSPPTTTSI